jgi:MtN3 and saliva related transmembrane protein
MARTLGNRDRHRRGILSTASFVPQCSRPGARGRVDLAAHVHGHRVGLHPWTLYGFVIGSWPVVVFNALSLVLSGTHPA